MNHIHPQEGHTMPQKQDPTQKSTPQQGPSVGAPQPGHAGIAPNPASPKQTPQK